MNKYVVTNPATGASGTSFALATDTEVTDAVGTADRAHSDFSRRTSVAERAALMQRVADLHTERREHLAELIVREMGKPVEQALGEVDFSADIYSYYATHGEAFLADEPIELLGGEGSAFIRNASLGVLLGIMPWNFPYYQVARFAGPNLVLGNTILLKHASQCPESAAAIEQIFTDAGFPEGAYRNLYASSAQIADIIIPDPRVCGVSLTGSEGAGAAVAEVAGRNLKKVVLELGGSDPFILLSTDDLEEAVDAAVEARMDNSGQSCNAAKRFIVIDGLYDAFVESFTAKMTGKIPADPLSPDTTLGPLSSLGAAEGLEEQLQRAETQGATVHARGRRDGAFFSPTVLTGVSPQSDAYREEFFGPVAAVYRVQDEAEAVQVANDIPYGLGSYLFTTDPEQALRIADQIDAGMVFINGSLLDGPELPFGGVKRSGFGRELGRFGIAEFANKKLIRILK
ncbi:NAD-dependent succinate-semialdehyde dehydrogenase [Cryobacterium sp. TMT2-10]|uniref:NAD-dependent succinate-semialdehyde dehydrogenase n=1 Tax=Cryobacterium shii TaxID=1259235 RepID=A0AAQ2HF31_9MICO|nr:MULTISPECIES: NAD-dependent succinate-semialdehyde dehydrogenase [Cryobacterium]TFC44388.1 NAD-dependent succinate-semialdehyde dehydrogenase [Cryobacterium shii]TFC88458.1 NAD-dependent succinate-semialdehyde dehydrogenase [Cryobacterium sp. TmT2-59]TFD18933.1 NAD-dependent succinate-semialdehyde dehydrogenase [Cryobacterium sp. TMT2-23]TFD20965.1 NAD-dependent succinate-semialdehyde dehydrogenase [Cryobacterium sp. TMT4-10]TFD35759.1 NAD-dependent succinate-semialdehyde dehydrogenase [Cry